MSPVLAWLMLSPALATEPVSVEAAPAAEPTERSEIEALREEIRLLRQEVLEAKSQPAEAPEPPDAVEPPEVAAPTPPIPPVPPVISGERVSYGTPVHVAAGEAVEEVASFGDDVIIDGQVLGDAVSFGGDVYLHDGAYVQGDAVSFGGTVHVDPGAVIGGDRMSFADGMADVEVGADEEADAPPVGGFASFVSTLYHRLILFLSFAGAGVLVVGLVPQRVGRVAATVDQHPIRTVAVGMFATGALLLTSLLFAITVIGLPVTFLLLAVLGLAWLVGFVGLSQSFGDRLPFRQKHHGRWFAFLIGTTLITFVTSLPVVGWLLVGVLSCVAVGAALTSRFGAR